MENQGLEVAKALEMLELELTSSWSQDLSKQVFGKQYPVNQQIVAGEPVVS